MPPTGDTEILTLTEPPAATLTGAVGAATVKVGAAPTVNVSAAEVDDAKAVFPEYAAVMLSEPWGRLLVAKAATPEEFTAVVLSKFEPL